MDKEEDFNDFFNDVINILPIKSSKIIKNSFSKAQTKAEKLLKENSQKFDSIFEPFLTDVTPEIRKKCHKTIHFASLTSAIVGFSPIPFSDAVLLVSIQLSMLTRLYIIFGEKW